ncbi:M28 family peptidase [Hyalangium sp.]|uniref:M28 family peptidase n=1 Tax=Hyalangium sp. TaxID=2028555 RepID=UPI002D3D9DC4|nr:M28 family peptidase [Hyalangium sp.]HYH98708.1 M28 family peptidase [Hyalangium sp.]
MAGWEELLHPLTEVSRENGSAGLQDAASYLAAALQSAGAQVEHIPYLASPWRLRVTGLLVLVGGCAYGLLMRKGKALAALAVALLVPAVLLAELDGYVPLVSRWGTAPQAHVLARIPAQVPPVQRLILAAHYDTKTDLLDHVERGPIELATLPATLFLMLGAAGLLALRRWPQAPRALKWGPRLATLAGPLVGVAYFLMLTAGAFIPERSPGALDDGASCAILVRLAQTLAASPLERTEVEILLLSGEEIGVQGSWEYARQRFARPPALPTALLNLEGLGATENLAVYGIEHFTLRRFYPDPRLVRLLDEVHQQARGRPLHVTSDPVVTDARSFLAHGIPSATLAGDAADHKPFRGMHSAEDHRHRVSIPALEGTLELLLTTVRLADTRELLRQRPETR